VVAARTLTAAAAAAAAAAAKYNKSNRASAVSSDMLSVVARLLQLSLRL
jgi:hypothetical protein